LLVDFRHKEGMGLIPHRGFMHHAIGYKVLDLTSTDCVD